MNQREENEMRGIRKGKYTCKGGPLDTQTLYLESSGTLLFTLRGQRGYYNASMLWVSVPLNS